MTAADAIDPDDPTDDDLIEAAHAVRDLIRAEAEMPRRDERERRALRTWGYRFAVMAGLEDEADPEDEED